MAQTILVGPVAITNFGPGTRNIPNTIIQDSAATMAVLSLDGAQMLDPALEIMMTLDQSTDDGATWGNTCTVTTQGGATDWRHGGGPLPTYNLRCPLVPEVNGVKRRLRGTVVVRNLPLTTTLTGYTE